MGAASPWNSTNPITPAVRSTVALAEHGSNLTNTYPEKSGTEITFWRSLQQWLSSSTGRNVSIPLFCSCAAAFLSNRYRVWTAYHGKPSRDCGARRLGIAVIATKTSDRAPLIDSQVCFGRFVHSFALRFGVREKPALEARGLPYSLL